MLHQSNGGNALRLGRLLHRHTAKAVIALNASHKRSDIYPISGFLREIKCPAYAIPKAIIYIFIRLDGQQTAHNTQLENTIKHNHTQLKER